MSVRANRLRAAQRALIALLVVWVAAHTVLMWKTGWSVWRLGGMGMYAYPAEYMHAAAIVACDDPSCRNERADVAFFAPTRNRIIPVLQPATGGAEHRYDLASIVVATDELLQVWQNFVRFPTQANARELVRFRLKSPCGPYFVPRYRQRISLPKRQASVDARPFVVSMPSEDCSRSRRVAASAGAE